MIGMLIFLVIKKLNPIETELFIRGRKLNISVVFITQSYFYCSQKYQNKFYELFHYKNSKQKRTSRIAFNHSSDIDFKNLMNLYKKYTAKPHSFSVIDATLASDNGSRFRKNLLERI